MSAREEALAILRERFPEPWAIEVVRLDSSCFVARAGTEPAERGPNPVRVYAEGDTAISAARACIAAANEAGIGERALADRLAEALEWSNRALRDVLAGRPTVVDECLSCSDAALAAHKERRKA